MSEEKFMESVTRHETATGTPVKAFYMPEDTKGKAEDKIGAPGSFPFSLSMMGVAQVAIHLSCFSRPRPDPGPSSNAGHPPWSRVLLKPAPSGTTRISASRSALPFPWAP